MVELFCYFDVFFQNILTFSQNIKKIPFLFYSIFSAVALILCHSFDKSSEVKVFFWENMKKNPLKNKVSQNTSSVTKYFHFCYFTQLISTNQGKEREEYKIEYRPFLFSMFQLFPPWLLGDASSSHFLSFIPGCHRALPPDKDVWPWDAAIAIGLPGGCNKTR